MPHKSKPVRGQRVKTNKATSHKRKAKKATRGKK